MGWGGLFVGYFLRISRHSWAIVLPIMPSRRARRAAKMIVCTIFNTYFRPYRTNLRFVNFSGGGRQKK